VGKKNYKRYKMRILVANCILVLFFLSGCGGGTTVNISTNGEEENESSLQQNSEIVSSGSKVQKLKDAGYKNPSNLYTLNDNKIAFTYQTSQSKSFCIYDTYKEQEISVINNFQGGTIQYVNNNNIYFSNNIFVNVENPWWIQSESYSQNTQNYNANYTATNQVQDSVSNEIDVYSMVTLYGDFHEWAFSPNKNGLLVVQQSDTDTHYYVMQRYGMEGGYAKLEEEFRGRFSNDGLVERVSALSYPNFKIEFSDGYVYIFDYKSGKLTLTNGGYTNQQSYNNTTSNVSNGTIASKFYDYVTHEYSLQRGGIFVIGRSRSGYYNFYRLNAADLAIEQKFENVSLNPNYSVYDIEALSGQRFRIQTSGGIYIFNYSNGDFYKI
jgi:hypothetical protein